MRHLRRLHGVSLRRLSSRGHRLWGKGSACPKVSYISAKPTAVSVSVSGGCKSPDKSVAVPVTPKAPLWPVKVTSSQPLSSA